jgi:hypothetical protein
MTKLFDDAIEQARQLPDEQQDAAAEALFAHLAGRRDYRLTADQAEEVERIRDNLRSGRTTLVRDDDMRAFWKFCGL